MRQTRRQTRRGTRRSRDLIGPLRKGRLSKFGYHDVHDLSETQRHSALSKAVEKFGSLSVWKMVNVLYIYNKRHPKMRDLFNRDRVWIKNTFGLKA